MFDSRLASLTNSEACNSFHRLRTSLRTSVHRLGCSPSHLCRRFWSQLPFSSCRVMQQSKSPSPSTCEITLSFSLTMCHLMPTAPPLLAARLTRLEQVYASCADASISVQSEGTESSKLTQRSNPANYVPEVSQTSMEFQVRFSKIVTTFPPLVFYCLDTTTHQYPVHHRRLQLALPGLCGRP